MEDLQFTTISNDDPDDIIRDIKVEHPNDGEVLMAGHLAVRHIHVPRYRLRAAIRRLDPVGTEERRRTTISRRVYSVDGPNKIWHYDGHHKLIRWRMVTHGCIDGYSRTIVYLHCSTNNTASTVLSHFIDAVRQYGLPKRVRSDLGGENVDVWHYMISQYRDESVVITGSSTHNERIERLWRDVFRCVVTLFYDTFYGLEAEGTLDPLNETDLYCLHYVYVPKINACLTEFAESWNHHRMSTEHNQTPYQMFVSNLPEMCASPRREFRDVCIPDTMSNRVTEPISVPRSTFQPCPNLVLLLDQLINPLDSSDDLSVGIYKRCIRLVGTHVSVCSHCSS